MFSQSGQKLWNGSNFTLALGSLCVAGAAGTGVPMSDLSLWLRADAIPGARAGQPVTLWSRCLAF